MQKLLHDFGVDPAHMRLSLITIVFSFVGQHPKINGSYLSNYWLSDIDPYLRSIF